MEARDEADNLPDGGEEDFVEDVRRAPLWRKVLLVVASALLVLVLYAWATREDIADNIIAAELERLGIPATYEIESVGPDRQVLRNIVVGDPARPDLTISRAQVTIVYRIGFPRVGGVTLVRPRLYGTFRNGKLSFGALDRLLFDETKKEPFELPEMKLTLVDGRALVETDYGPVGAKAEGSGQLRGGFKGILAVAAPKLDGEGCSARNATLYGTIATADARPRFSGPFRLASAACPQSGLALARVATGLAIVGDSDFAGFDSSLDWRSRQASYGSGTLAGVNGTAAISWRKGALMARYDLAARGIESPQVQAALLTGEGTLRARRSLTRVDWDGDWEGNGLRIGSGLAGTLAGLEQSSEGTMLAPILSQIRAALLREGRGSTLVAQTTLRTTGDGWSIVVPEARLQGGSGATLFSLSRMQFASGKDGVPRLFGNFTTGGPGLPNIAGRIDRRSDGRTALRLTMARYAAGGGSVQVPELLAVQRQDGAIGFAGSMLASGALPGGSADDLLMPLSGNWSPATGLSLWRECTDLRFARLSLAGLTLERKGLKLCPQRGGAIVRVDGRGTRIAAGTPGLDLAGRLGASPIAIRSGPVGFALPGVMSARNLDVALGPSATATRFRLDDLTARVGKDIAGRFSGADFRLYQVPLDVIGATGDWRFAGGVLTLADAEFRVEDRQDSDRFEPLIGRGGQLMLANNVITASVPLQEPASGRMVTNVALRHDLGTGIGHADLAVPGLLFDDRLQPDTLSGLALGVIANAKGKVTGQGRIDWNPQGVTSTGTFSTDSLDFAAAFGPVHGLSGTVEFTDLLNLVTAPRQRVKIARINPGIEVDDGEVVFAMKGNNLLAVEGASWPFMGGTLRMRPLAMTLGKSESRRFVLEIEGLDAAQFVERMELANLSATGTFDGTIPLVFDENGGRLEEGLLVSRPPGGTVAYIGELTYKDLSAMANFAFDALRSLNYTRMTIAMDGELTGELVTRVRFDGVKQGKGTKQNFLTRQVAKLPIRFNVNVRAPFYKLITTFKSMYDPAFVRDPRELGLIDERGNPIRDRTSGLPPVLKPEDIIPDEPPVQPRESENAP